MLPLTHRCDSQEADSFYLPRGENAAPPVTQWQDASTYLDVNFDHDASFRHMAQRTY